MHKNKLLYRWPGTLKTKPLTQFDVLAKLSFNIGGNPSEVLNEMIEIVESNPELMLMETKDAIFARYLDKPCILEMSSSQFDCGIWFPLDWYFTILTKSPVLAQCYLSLLLDKRYSKILYCLEENNSDEIDSLLDTFDEDVFETKEEEREHNKYIQWMKGAKKLAIEMANLKTFPFELKLAKQHAHEFPEAYKMILQIYNYLEKNYTRLHAFFHPKSIDPGLIMYPFGFNYDKSEEKIYPNDLLGICFSCESKSDHGDPVETMYPADFIFERIDSYIMEAGYDINVYDINLYMKNGYKKVIQNFGSFVKTTNSEYYKILAFAEVHKSQNIWKQIRNQKVLSFRKISSLFTTMDTSKLLMHKCKEEKTLLQVLLPQ